MGFFSKLLVLLLNYAVYGVLAKAEIVTTTTKSYDLDVPGSNPIRIVEGESLWSTPKPNSRSWRGPYPGPTRGDDFNDQNIANNVKFSSSALREFLKDYAAKLKNRDESLENLEEKEKKSWNMMNVKQHNHPYDDKDGWVTLEPLPWSLSKISKWHSKPKPVEVYSTNDKSWNNDYDYPNEKPTTWRKPVQHNNYQYNHKPEAASNPYQMYQVDEDMHVGRPSYSKPTTHYGQSVHVEAMNHNRNPIKVNNYYKHDNCNHDENVAIITDGQPANFPTDHYDGNRRMGTELQPKTHPFLGEGEWVLLSTTKGYKRPKNRQRSLEINPDSIGTHRSVRLTVLPPLKNSKVNMTTSHGGLLQVDSTPETVEQAQRKFTKSQKAKQRRKKPSREITASTIATIPRNTRADSGAVLAGVSAGILPATMAMLVPIAMNGKRRKRREAPPNPTASVEITLPRYL